jgi:hypothetical protein
MAKAATAKLRIPSASSEVSMKLCPHVAQGRKNQTAQRQPVRWSPLEYAHVPLRGTAFDITPPSSVPNDVIEKPNWKFVPARRLSQDETQADGRQPTLHQIPLVVNKAGTEEAL